jgi:hypothetical protein
MRKECVKALPRFVCSKTKSPYIDVKKPVSLYLWDSATSAHHLKPCRYPVVFNRYPTTGVSKGGLGKVEGREGEGGAGIDHWTH